MSHLKGKVAVVTGGSRGIGRAIVQYFTSQGCHVAFNYHSNHEAAEDLVKSLSTTDVKVLSHSIDIRDFSGVKGWMRKVKEDLGPIDILVNNAGIIADKPLMMMTEEDWSSVIQTHLNGLFNATRACIVDFMKQKSGNVINISSLSGVIGLPGQTNYSAAKGGMNSFTKALAKEVAKRGVRVNAIAPGFIETDILKNFTPEQKTNISATIPLGRIGDVADVVHCVDFLLSELATYITGQILQVDGGLAIR